MKRMFFNLDNEKEAQITVDALLAWFAGKEYVWASTSNKSDEIDLHPNHHLAQPYNGKAPVHYSVMDHCIALYISDSYGLHYVYSNELDQIYISSHEVSIKHRWMGLGEIIERRHTLFKITGEYKAE